MKEQIINYYSNEKQWSTYGLLIAIGLLIVSVLLWKTAGIQTLQRGLACAIGIMAVLFIFAASLTINHNNKRIAKAQQISVNDEVLLKQLETERMEEVMRNAYTMALITFSVALVIGVALLVVVKAPLTKGIAWGLVLFGIYGLLMESISMRKNWVHLEEVRHYEVNNRN